MRLRCRRPDTSLVLIVLCSLITAVPTTGTTSTGLTTPTSRDGPPPSSTTTDAAQSTATSRTKADEVSKPAPVDGMDGKPHAGPWVRLGADRASPVPSMDDSAGRKPSPRPLATPAIPKVNDGVMDDPNRETPKKGTTGTEGGVSEKDRHRKAHEGQTGERAEKRPDPPKEAPPLPHSEQEKIRETAAIKDGTGPERIAKLVDQTDPASDLDTTTVSGGLAKPVDLPPKPHDVPPPSPPSSPKADPLGLIRPDSPIDGSPSTTATTAKSLIQPLHSAFLALTMILFSEVGDKTFLIAALMAMKHPRLLVFSAAFSALIAMTVLSAVLGHAVPSVISKRYTNFLAGALFVVFGLKMLHQGYTIGPEEDASEEMKEVEMELEEREHQARKYGGHRRSSLIGPYVLEAGGRRSETVIRQSRSHARRLPSPRRSPSSSASSRSPSPSSRTSPAATTATNVVRNLLASLNNLTSFLLSPAWVQTFLMTFFGEWGDRSQIATIAMAAGQDYWWVTAGAVTGHALCTAVAVLGGRAVAGRVSLRVVTLGGALSFLTFGLIYFVEAMYYLTP